jgi:hypothetical protein
MLIRQGSSHLLLSAQESGELTMVDMDPEDVV